MAAHKLRAIADNAAVHLKIYPPPRNLAESCQVQRQLEAFGELVMFKNLKYERRSPMSNAALVIFKSKDSAERAVAASPLCFKQMELHSASLSSMPDESLVSKDESVHDDAHPVSSTPGEYKHGHSSQTYREILVNITSSYFDHRAYIEKQNPFYGSWTPDVRSVLAEDLGRNVELDGLKDWSGDWKQRRNPDGTRRSSASAEEERPEGLRRIWHDGMRASAGGDRKNSIVGLTAG